MKMKKRLLSILLSLVLMLGLVPGMSLTAYADNDGHPDNLTIAVTPDGTGTVQHNGYTYTAVPTEGYRFVQWKLTGYFYSADNPLIETDNPYVADSQDYNYYTITAVFAPVTKYPLWVGGTQVTSENAADTTSHPTWSYDADSKILTLNGYTYNGPGYENAGICAEQDLTISITGTNNIKANSHGVKVYNDNITITGSGSLTVSGQETGIYSGKSITINGGTVDASGTQYAGIYGMGTCSITINSGTVNAQGPYGIRTTDGILAIKGGTVNANGAGSWSSGLGGKSVMIGGGTVTAVAGGDNSSGISSVEGTTISGGIITASGSSKAIKNINQNTVKNSITGVGWTNTAGTEGKTFISASTSGQELNCLKVQFPAKTVEVTFKVVNGSWNDDTSDAKTVMLFGPEGTDLKLTKEQIPSVGTKPKDATYMAGSWDVTPSTDTAITAATTYTYTYAQKEAATVKTAPVPNTLTYNGSAQELVTAGEPTGGTMQYAIGTDATTAPTTGWAESIPTGTDAGTYYVWYMVKADEKHIDSEAECVEATIAKAEAKVKTAPKAIEGLVSDGKAHELVKAGESEGGIMQYALGKDEKTAPTDGWKKDLPTGTDAGTYNVWYYVKGDENHLDSKAACVTVTISAPAPGPDPEPQPQKIDISKAKWTYNKSHVYTGKVHRPPMTVKLNGKKLVQNLDYVATFVDNKEIGTATVTITGIGDYTGSQTGKFTIVPPDVKLKKLDPGKKKNSIDVSWKQGIKNDGYEVQYSLQKNFKGAKKITVKGAKNLDCTIKKLKVGKTYYVRVRTYKKAKGKMYYSAWSNVESLKIEK